MAKYAVYDRDGDQKASDDFDTKEEAEIFFEENGIDADYYEVMPVPESQDINFNLSLVENLEKYLVAFRCVGEDEMYEVVEDLAEFIEKIEDHYKIEWIKMGEAKSEK